MAPRLDPGFADLSAAADFLGNGAIETNRYESEIVDLVRRGGIEFGRFPAVPATGHPHRYFEQTLIATGAFTDPRSIAPSASSPTRVERAAFIKAITSQTNFSLFDVDVTRMQGQFAATEAKDIEDITSAILNTEAPAIWAGSDTSLSSPTTNQYVGLLTQITDQAVIAPGASIIDGLKAKVAAMVARTDFVVRPTAIWTNPVSGDLVDREAKASKIDMNTIEVTGGVKVSALQTQQGPLPLISSPWLQPWNGAANGFSAPPAGNKTYPFVILTEAMIERPTVHGGDGNMNPRLFQLGLLANLAAQYVGVHFNAVIAKGYAYAHSVVGVQRP
jgi:hypothetical protein